MTSVERRYGLPLTQQQLADHVGLTTVHGGRILRRFREKEMVAVGKFEVVFLKNTPRLEEIARPVLDFVGE
jgi:CRP/FNR family transcriptional regulator, anaerobic regulatory protein